MAVPDKKIIKEIAENLDCGFDCYYNPNTQEIVAIPNISGIYDEKQFKEAFQIDVEKVLKQKANYIKFEPLESFESFKIMERFIDQVTDMHLQSELGAILQRKKPFQNFKYAIDNSDFRQKWFDFKQKELEEFIEKQLIL
jgi:hypothetical protein